MQRFCLSGHADDLLPDAAITKLQHMSVGHENRWRRLTNTYGLSCNYKYASASLQDSISTVSEMDIYKKHQSEKPLDPNESFDGL